MMAGGHADLGKPISDCNVCSELIKNGIRDKCSICETLIHKNCVRKFINEDVLVRKTAEAARSMMMPIDPPTGGGQGQAEFIKQRRNEVHSDTRAADSDDEVEKLKNELARSNELLAEITAELKRLDEESEVLKERLKISEERQNDDNEKFAESENELSYVYCDKAELECDVSELLFRELSATADLKISDYYDQELSCLYDSVEAEKSRCLELEAELSAFKSKYESSDILLTNFKIIIDTLEDENNLLAGDMVDSEDTMEYQSSDERCRADDEANELVKEITTLECFDVSAENAEYYDDGLSEQFIKSALKSVNGRNEIGILWKRYNIRLPDDLYPKAVRRCINAEISTDEKPEVSERMEDHLVSLIERGQTRMVTEAEYNMKDLWKKVWKLSTLFYFNENKNPTRPKCEWDIAVKLKSDGVTLNSFVLTGPDNDSLIARFMRFFAVGDIVATFHLRILIADDQQCRCWMLKFKKKVAGCNMKVGEPTTLFSQAIEFGPTDSLTEIHEVKNIHSGNYGESRPEVSGESLKFTYVADSIISREKYPISGKNATQDFWFAETDWDGKINGELVRKLRSFPKSFDLMVKIRILSHYVPNTFIVKSVSLFEAVCYIRFTFQDEVATALSEEEKIAPYVHASFTQFELQTDVHGVNEAEILASLHSFEIHKKKFLTDSTCVSSRLRSPKLKLKPNQIIRLRIDEMLEKSASPKWFHIFTFLNAADEATKITPKIINAESCRWLTGPEFIKLLDTNCPITQQTYEVVKTHIADKPQNTIDQMKSKFRAQSFTAGTVAPLRRLRKMLIKNEARSPQEKFISASKFACDELSVFYKIQGDAHPDENRSLTERTSCDAEEKAVMNSVSSSSSSSPSEFLMHENKVADASTRYRKLLSCADRKPMKLPNRQELVSTFIGHHEEKNHHFEAERNVANINQAVAVFRVMSRYVWCKLLSMSAEPECLIDDEPHKSTTTIDQPAFTIVEVDSFSPFYIKRRRGTEKLWIALFTCPTFRAIHVNVLFKMTADSIMGAMRNIAGRREKIVKPIAENMSNIPESEKLSRHDHDEILHTFGEKIVSERKAEVRIIPADSPSTGGATEIQNYAVKRVMRETLPVDLIEEKTFSNNFIEAEIIINNCPLTHTSTIPEDDCPNIKLSRPKEPPIYVIDSREDVCSYDPYYKSQSHADQFITRCDREYRRKIIRRAEKIPRRRKIPLDDNRHASLPDEKKPEWKMKRVMKTHPSKDGVTRRNDVPQKIGKIQNEGFVCRCTLFDLRVYAVTTAR